MCCSTYYSHAASDLLVAWWARRKGAQDGSPARPSYVYRASLCAHAGAAPPVPSSASERIPCGAPLSDVSHTPDARFDAEACPHSDLSPCAAGTDDAGFLLPAPPSGQRPAAEAACDAGAAAAGRAADDAGGGSPAAEAAAAGEQAESLVADDPYEDPE